MTRTNFGARARHSAIRKTTYTLLSITPTLVAILGAAPPAFAADSSQTSQAEVEEIVVTGTRIVRDGYEAPTPVTVLGTKQLEGNASSNIASALTALPAIMGSNTTASQATIGGNGTAGTNRLSLRGLGAARTLVLVDGHRMPPAIPAGGVDINMLPQGLISRVDVVTGGASAVYGSDAVAGVVNFILDREFTGVKGEISGGATTYGDVWNDKVDLAAGFRFAGDRGHVLLSGEQVFDEGLGGSKRDFQFAGASRMANPAYTATNGAPQFLVVTGTGFTQLAPGGIIFTGPLKGTIFGQGGAATQFTYGSFIVEPMMQGGDWRVTDRTHYNPLTPRELRQNLFGRVSYDISDNVNIYAQYIWTHERTRAVISTNFLQGTNGPLIASDNAFLPANIRAQMVALKVTSFRLGTFNLDLGLAEQTTDRTEFTYQVGAAGKFELADTTWTWDVFAQRGLSKGGLDIPASVGRARYFLATDAVFDSTGKIVCRSTLTNPNNGCTPYNPLGVGVNADNSGGKNYVLTGSTQNVRMAQNIVGGTVTGEPFSNWAGPVSLALDLQHRADSAKAVTDAGSLVADHVFGNYFTLQPSHDHVTEGAAEVVVPLAKGKPWADAWDLNAAVRATGYGLAGYVTTWKVGTTYTPIQDIRFRAARSRDIRAPNLQEQMADPNSQNSNVFDPITGATPFIPRTVVGNTALKPETGDNASAGVVLQPSFFPGFTTSVDYWDINMKDIVTTLTDAQVVSLCVDRKIGCENTVRDSAGNLIQLIRKQINLAHEHIKGIDIEGSYTLPLDTVSDKFAGTFDLRAFYSVYLSDIQDTGLGTVTQMVGSNGAVGDQKWRMNITASYQLDPLTMSVTARGFGRGKQDPTWVGCTSGCPASTATNPTVDNPWLPGKMYWDLAFNYDFGVGDNATATAFLNVRNLTDSDPPPQISSGVYDVIGRTIRLGVRFKMK